MSNMTFVRILCNGGDGIFTGDIIVRTISEQKEPLQNVTIKIFQRKNHQNFLIHESKTDTKGISKKINLESPDTSLSLTPLSTTSPYAKYNFHISKDGYISEIRNGIHIFSGIDSTLEIVMQKNSSEEDHMNTIDMEEHILVKNKGETQC